MKFKGKRVFITGGTGLLGSHLTRILVEQGADVVCLIRDNVPKSLFYSSEPGYSLDQKVSIVRGDLTDFNTIERAVNEYEVEYVFHLGAQTIVGVANSSPLATFESNIKGTWNILEAARLHHKIGHKKIKGVLIASSDKAYGNLKGESYNEETPLQGEHPYDVSKSCADLISQTYFHSYGLPVCVTRCGNFFGPGDLNWNRIIPGTIRDLHEGRAPVIRSDGKFIRDYIYAEDGAYAYLTLAEQMEGYLGEAFNFSYGLRLSVLEVVSAIQKIMKKESIKPTILNQASNEIPVQTLDSAKAKNKLGWKAKFGFEEGLRKTVDWYVQLLERA